MDENSFRDIFKTIYKEAINEAKRSDEARTYDYYKYRLCYLTVPSKTLIFIFIADLSDSDKLVKRQVVYLKEEFLNLFGSTLDSKLDSSDLDILTPVVERIHKDLSAKISLVGFSGVGKTTITALIRAQEIPVEHVPTITGDVGTIQIGKLTFSLWDFAGQEQFNFLWNKFVKGSDAVLIITDSTLENVDKSRFFLELVKQEAPQAHLAIIGNKQDLPGALPVPEIERLLDKVHAYSMVAVDPANREKMINIIADILEVSPEISPLLKPLIERDKKVDAIETAVKNGDFQAAYHLSKEIADICLMMGDDTLSQEFTTKSEKLRETLQKLGQLPTAPRVAAPTINQPKLPPTPQTPPVIPPPPPSIKPSPTPIPAVPTISPPALGNNLPPNERKKELEDTIVNLRINLANLDKYLLDFEMQVLMGKASDVEYQEKKKKTALMKQNIEKQIVQFQDILKDIP